MEQTPDMREMDKRKSNTPYEGDNKRSIFDRRNNQMADWYMWHLEGMGLGHKDLELIFKVCTDILENDKYIERLKKLGLID